MESAERHSIFFFTRVVSLLLFQLIERHPIFFRCEGLRLAMCVEGLMLIVWQGSRLRLVFVFL